MFYTKNEVTLLRAILQRAMLDCTAAVHDLTEMGQQGDADGMSNKYDEYERISDMINDKDLSFDIEDRPIIRQLLESITPAPGHKKMIDSILLKMDYL